MNFKSFYSSRLYKGFRIQNLCKGIFYIIKLIIKKFRGANPKSFKVKTNDDSTFYLGFMK